MTLAVIYQHFMTPLGKLVTTSLAENVRNDVTCCRDNSFSFTR